MNLPNTLTLFRIALIPFFVMCLMLGFTGYALLIFVIAGATDAVDGTLARLLNQKTALGVLLDPLADKMLVLSALIALTFLKKIPLWLTVPVLARDLIILAGSVYLYRGGHGDRIKPAVIGKVTTFMLLVLLVVALIGLYLRKDIPAEGWLEVFCLILIIISGIQYLIRGFGILFGKSSPRLCPLSRREESGGEGSCTRPGAND